MEVRHLRRRRPPVSEAWEADDSRCRLESFFLCLRLDISQPRRGSRAPIVPIAHGIYSFNAILVSNYDTHGSPAMDRPRGSRCRSRMPWAHKTSPRGKSTGACSFEKRQTGWAVSLADSQNRGLTALVRASG